MLGNPKTYGVRYTSVKQVPIRKEDVIKTKENYIKIKEINDKTKKQLLENVQKIYGEEYTPKLWIQISSLYDQNFLNKFIAIWKKKVFQRVTSLTLGISSEREKEIIQECLNDSSLSNEVEKYFLSDFWKHTPFYEMYK